MRYIIVLKCQHRDQQLLGLVLHTSETVNSRECKRRTREKEAAILGAMVVHAALELRSALEERGKRL